MSYVRGANRSQVQLLPGCVEDYVADNAPVRFIDVFVDGLDMRALKFTHAQPAQTGRPAYDPADLLKLYVYGYLNRIRSSRRLEAESGRNLEVMWLLKGLRPDFKTIADFRKDNRGAFKPVLRQFNLLCRRLDLFGAELVAIDGSKFKAVNNPRHHYRQDQLKALMVRIEQRVDEYLAQLDQQDQEAEGVVGRPTRQELEEKIRRLQERRGEYEQVLGALSESGQKEVSLVDPDSRSMKKVGVGYNVQIAVDAKHHLIVEPEVVQSACDRNQLSGMAQAAKKQLAVAKLQAVADAGYHEADQLEACEQASIETYVPETGTTRGQGAKGRKVYGKDQFVYEANTDSYRCPGQQTLERGSVSTWHGREVIRYYKYAACAKCALKSQCTSSRMRVISRRTNEAVLERQAERLRAHPEMMSKRKTIAEHVFGTLRHWGHDRFLMRGLENVRAEFSLSALTYNLRRVLRLWDVPALLEKLSKAQPATA